MPKTVAFAVGCMIAECNTVDELRAMIQRGLSVVAACNCSEAEFASFVESVCESIRNDANDFPADHPIHQAETLFRSAAKQHQV